MSEPESTETRRRRPWVRYALLTLLAAVVLGVGTTWWLWTSDPGYYTAQLRFLAAAAPEEVDAMASSLEKRVLANLSEDTVGMQAAHGSDPPTADDGEAAADAALPSADSSDDDAPDTDGPDPRRPPNARRIELGVNEVNAWLSAHLPRWLANQDIELPKEVRDPLFAIEDGRLLVAFRMQTPDVDQVVSFVFDARLTADQMLFLKLHQVRGGRLPLPVEPMLTRLRESRMIDHLGGDTKLVLDWAHQALQGHHLEPVAEIDGKRFRLLGLDVEEDRVGLTFRVERRQSANRR